MPSSPSPYALWTADGDFMPAGTAAPQAGGAKTEPKKTEQKVVLAGTKLKRSVYVGAKGAQYVRVDGKFVALKKAIAMAEKAAKKKIRDEKKAAKEKEAAAKKKAKAEKKAKKAAEKEKKAKAKKAKAAAKKIAKVKKTPRKPKRVASAPAAFQMGGFG
jgi:hypothetical protein